MMIPLHLVFFVVVILTYFSLSPSATEHQDEKKPNNGKAPPGFIPIEKLLGSKLPKLKLTPGSVSVVKPDGTVVSVDKLIEDFKATVKPFGATLSVVKPDGSSISIERLFEELLPKIKYNGRLVPLGNPNGGLKPLGNPQEFDINLPDYQVPTKSNDVTTPPSVTEKEEVTESADEEEGISGSGLEIVYGKVIRYAPSDDKPPCIEEGDPCMPENDHCCTRFSCRCNPCDSTCKCVRLDIYRILG